MHTRTCFYPMDPRDQIQVRLSKCQVLLSLPQVFPIRHENQGQERELQLQSAKESKPVWRTLVSSCPPLLALCPAPRGGVVGGWRGWLLSSREGPVNDQGRIFSCLTEPRSLQAPHFFSPLCLIGRQNPDAKIGGFQL